MTRLLLVLLFVLPWSGDGEKEGRRGNALYRQDLFEEAAQMYRDGLGLVPADALGSVPAGLLNNLGAALYRSGDFQGAAGALAASLERALVPEDIGRAAYNGGNAAFKAEELEGALGAYRKALMTDPTDEDARFNYEFVKRKLEEQEQNQDENQDQQDQDQDQDQNQDQQQNDQQNEEQQDEQQQEQQQQEQEQQQQEQQQQQQQDQSEMSPQEAQRILEALENEEEQLLRQVQKMKTRPRRVEKDW